MHSDRLYALIIVPVSSSVCLAQKAASDFVTPQSFKNAPDVYRPIATLSDHGVSANVMDQEWAAFQMRGYGSVLFGPSPRSCANISCPSGGTRRRVRSVPLKLAPVSPVFLIGN